MKQKEAAKFRAAAAAGAGAGGFSDADRAYQQMVADPGCTLLLRPFSLPCIVGPASSGDARGVGGLCGCRAAYWPLLPLREGEAHCCCRGMTPY